MKKTSKEYILELTQKNPSVLVKEEYCTNKTKILHQCVKCSYQWKATPNDILSKQSGCPVCKGSKIGPPPFYINSIWASVYKDFFSLYLTEQQMKEYMPFSNQKIVIKCPDCYKEKTISLKNLLNNGLGCVCRDGCSYPNKFVFAVLNQVTSVEVELSLIDKNQKIKRYDIFIPSLNCIVENQGLQHYVDAWQTLQQTQFNDTIKKELALQQGIKYYVELDCRYSQKHYIQQSIMNSQLPTLLNFSQEDIDWEKAEEFASSNLIKKVAEYWNEGLNNKNISKKMSIAECTVIDYLKKAKDLQWCDYSTKEARRRGNEIGKYKHSKKVYCLETQTIYNSIKEVANTFQVSHSAISANCRGKNKKIKGYHFYYLEDQYINNKTIQGAISLGLIK